MRRQILINNSILPLTPVFWSLVYVKLAARALDIFFFFFFFLIGYTVSWCCWDLRFLSILYQLNYKYWQHEMNLTEYCIKEYVQ